MTPRLRIMLLAALGAAAAGCGQQGPLSLPQGPRPTERVDAPVEPEQPDDDEQQDER